MGWLKEAVEKHFRQIEESKPVTPQVKKSTEVENNDWIELEKKQEAREAFSKLGVEDLLLDVQREVWQGGVLDDPPFGRGTVVDEDGAPRSYEELARVRLVYNYTKVSQGGPTYVPLTGIRTGWVPTREIENSEVLSVSLVANPERAYFYYMLPQHSDGIGHGVGYSTQKGLYLVLKGLDSEVIPFPNDQAVDKIKDFLIRDSIQRIQKHHLPKDLKSERLIPRRWWKRLF